MSFSDREIVRRFCEGQMVAVAMFLDTNGIVGEDRTEVVEAIVEAVYMGGEQA